MKRPRLVAEALKRFRLREVPADRLGERDRSQRSAQIIGGGPVDRCPRAVRAAHQVANGCRLPFPDDSAHDDELVSLARLRFFRGLRLSRSMSRAA